MEDGDTVAGMLARAIAALDDQYVVAPAPGHFIVGNGGVQVRSFAILRCTVSFIRGLFSVALKARYSDSSIRIQNAYMQKSHMDTLHLTHRTRATV